MTSGPKVLFVISSFTVGGAEKQLAQYVAARPASMAGIDLEIIAFLPTNAPDVEALFQDMNIPRTVIDRQATSFPVFFWRLLRAVRLARPTIVHTILAGSTGTWGRLAARLAGVPYIFHSDRNYNPPVERSHQLLRPILDRWTHSFLPNAEASARWLADRGVPPSKITVVPNVVDLARFDPASARSLRAEWGVPEGATVAGFLAKLRPEKRLDLLLDAFLAIPAEDRPDYLVIGGDGPVMPMVRECVQSDPWLREHCLLLGLVKDTVGFIAGIDYLVSSSDREGLPNVVLEAMAMAKPIVATAVSDVPRLIEGAGILAEPGSVSGLAGSIRRMQRLQPAERAVLGNTGRARVCEQYEIRRAAQRFWDVHLHVLMNESVTGHAQERK